MLSALIFGTHCVPAQYGRHLLLRSRRRSAKSIHRDRHSRQWSLLRRGHQRLDARGHGRRKFLQCLVNKAQCLLFDLISLGLRLLLDLVASNCYEA